MKILLVGHSIIDNIDFEGIKRILPGGIFYSVLGTLAVKNTTDQICLLTSMNKENYFLFEKVYSRINRDFLIPADSMPEVFLQISEVGERGERYLNISRPLMIDGIGDWNRFGGILINMITGFDISAGQLKTIRENYSGPIYFDLHTLSRGVDEKLNRDFRPVPDINDWLKNIDILQCNQYELRTIGNSDNTKNIETVLNAGAKYLIVTRGEKGASLYFKDLNEIKIIDKPAKAVKVVNKVGCGDVFGSVFFYNYLCRKDAEFSLEQAIEYSGRAVSVNIFNNIDLFIND